MRLLLLLLLLVTPGPAVPQPAISMPTSPVAYQLPLAGPLVVTRDFDPPAGHFGAGHRGVDLAAPAGSTVLAAADGVVSYAGDLAGRIVVAVTHADGLRTTYEPLAGLTVHLHEWVLAGASLGTLAPGHPGCSAPAPEVCLHWGALHEVGGYAAYVDPLLLLDREPVTLLTPVP